MRAPRILRWLQALVWLLALALPLQTQARVSMLGCGPVHEAPAPQPHQMMDGADHHVHHHQQAEPSEPQTHAKASHQCSACAACCIGAALPSAALQLEGPTGHGVRLAAPEPASLDVVTALLERPPRPFLA